MNHVKFMEEHVQEEILSGFHKPPMTVVPIHPVLAITDIDLVIIIPDESRQRRGKIQIPSSF